MVCVYCSHDTEVINSRLQKRPNQVWRRRRCNNCQNVFSTLEGVDWAGAVRVHNHKHLEPFSCDKLFLSIYEASKHRKTAVNDATALTRTIISKLWSHIKAATLTRDQIVHTTSEVLKRFDRAAAVQYVAFHPLTKP
jgi:transcriptional repressor NrdR